MRFLKLASAKNPENDFILLNGGYYDKDLNIVEDFKEFNGLLCTSFQTLGLNRKLEFLETKNRQLTVDNKSMFKELKLSIEILSKYSEYEDKYRELMHFIGINKNIGFRLYYLPDNIDKENIRYCLCDVKSVEKTDKLQPIILTLTQNSLWIGKEIKKTTSFNYEEEENLFVFKNDGGYYSVGFFEDEDIKDYYSVAFYSNIETSAVIENESNNEVPLTIRIYGKCENPVVKLFVYGERSPIKTTEITASIGEGFYLELNANIDGCGVWYVNNKTGEKEKYDDVINNNAGSPYFFIKNGKYILTVQDDNANTCISDIFYNEEYD
jgi:hypothetical protein